MKGLNLMMIMMMNETKKIPAQDGSQRGWDFLLVIQKMRGRSREPPQFLLAIGIYSCFGILGFLALRL